MTTNSCFCVLKGFEIINHSKEAEQLTYSIKNESEQRNVEFPLGKLKFSCTKNH